MFLTAMEMANFRSVAAERISPCANFNVLIGKNNSGKSNILAAIETFFRNATPECVTLNSVSGRTIDFFGKDQSLPLQITAVFALTAEERSTLIREIGLEWPQVQNALDGLDARLSVAITLQIKSTPKPYAYVHSVFLRRPNSPENGQILFEMPEGAAAFLYEIGINLSRAKREKSQIEQFLRQFDESDYAGARRRSREAGSPPFDFFLRRYAAELSGPIVTEIREALEASEGYSTFREAISQIASASEAKVIKAASQMLPVKIRSFSGEENAIPAYIKSLLSKVAAIKLVHLRERRDPIGQDEARLLLKLKIQRGGNDTLNNIQSTVRDLLGVKVDAFEASGNADGLLNYEPAARHAPNVAAELDVDDFLIQANGAGIREALRLILDTEFQKPDILLVEEPEIHLHPALETSVLKYLKNVAQNAQVFITTHSTNFLDAGSFENVFLISKSSGSTSATLLTLADAESTLPSELGIRLSSLFMYDHLLFVEGPSDEQIVRTLATKLGINFGQYNIGFIHMRGVRNIGHYAAAEIISFLTKRKVKLSFLVDSDEGKSYHFVRLKDELGDKADVRILGRREIENYLLSADANCAYLTERKRTPNGSVFSAPSIIQVKAEIEECAGGLKNTAIWKRLTSETCRPLIPRLGKVAPDDAKEMKAKIGGELDAIKREIEQLEADLDRLATEASETVERTWDKKLFVVPGSAILDAWYKKYGLRFDKLRDGPAIANLLRTSEIDAELQGFIEGLRT
jgi:predicted ATP-dependent endonuclease of OLD family